MAGSLDYNEEARVLTYDLGNPLDTAAENGSYTIGITLTDKARNTVQIVRRFTFDSVAPSVTQVLLPIEGRLHLVLVLINGSIMLKRHSVITLKAALISLLLLFVSQDPMVLLY